LILLSAGIWRWWPKTDRNFSIPHSHPSALVWHQGELWISDWLDQTIYRYGLEGRELKLNRSYHLPETHITGLALVGDLLYTCDSWKKEIRKRRIDETLTLLGKYPSPGEQPSCLFWDGRYLWSCDAQKHRIYRHQLDSRLTVLEQFPSPSQTPVALYKDEKYLWSADADKRLIYQHRLDSELSVMVSYRLPDLEEGKQSLSAFTWSQDKLWLGRDGKGLIYRRSFRKLEPVAVSKN